MSPERVSKRSVMLYDMRRLALISKRLLPTKLFPFSRCCCVFRDAADVGHVMHYHEIDLGMPRPFSDVETCRPYSYSSSSATQ